MNTRIDIKISAQYNSNTVTTTISHVSSTATDAQLLAMGEALNGLTQNTYTKTDKITTFNLDTAGGE